MEVKIGVRNVVREVVVESEDSQEAVVQQITDAVAAGTVLRLTDERGRTVIVPAAQIGYVEIGAAESRRVGFGTA